MKINIIIPYRPLSPGGMSAPHGNESFELRQDAEERWIYPGLDSPIFGGSKREQGTNDELKRAIKYLSKNSKYEHNIIVAIDPDVYPHDNYLKEFKNISFIKHNELFLGHPYIASRKMNAALIKAINSIPDEDWLCYDYISDLICGKDWDGYIIEEIKKHGENNVYVPMFTEVRSGYNNINLMGLEPTPKRIWEDWRTTVCCHALTMPQPQKGYFDEVDMNYYIKRANEAGNEIFIEKPGDRIYGYFAVMIMKAKYAKRAIKLEGGFDILFDNRLYSECHLNKVVVAKSFVFHPFCEFKEQ